MNCLVPRSLWAIVCLCLTASVAGAQDELQLRTGATLRGKIVSQEGGFVTLQVMVGGKTFTRRFRNSQVESIKRGGNPSNPTTATGDSEVISRTKAQVLALINSEGRTAPDWFESTPLDYPQTLDLSWPMPPPKGWNNSKNVGQFVWDRVNPNPGKWRSGIRLMHHIMSVNRSNRKVVEQAMRSLGSMYHNLLEDYPRAAFWWHQAGIDRNPSAHSHLAVRLANCYFRLGNRDMALELLDDLGRYPLHTIKLLGDLGETDRALGMAERFSKQTNPVACFLYAGDVCRVADRLQEAEKYYQRALVASKSDQRNKNHAKRDRQRAEASLAAIRFYQLKPADVEDGTYTASSLGYEDQVEVEVTVRSGRIDQVKVIRHREKQFYSSISDTPRRIIDRQSVAKVDTTSSATITSEAIINATAKALAKGLK